MPPRGVKKGSKRDRPYKEVKTSEEREGRSKMDKDELQKAVAGAS